MTRGAGWPRNTSQGQQSPLDRRGAAGGRKGIQESRGTRKDPSFVQILLRMATGKSSLTQRVLSSTFQEFQPVQVQDPGQSVGHSPEVGIRSDWTEFMFLVSGKITSSWPRPSTVRRY